jgi:5-methylcytosine-specific restriction endonuclease McrA
MTDDEELRRKFISILTKGSKSNTYKFALARFLLDHSHKRDSSSTVSFQDIAKKFLKYYWHQECKYRIRQNYDPKKIPSVVQVIRQVFEEEMVDGYIPAYFEDMPREKIKNAEEEIKRSVFGSGKKSQVVPRFQRLKGQQPPDRNLHIRGTGDFYDYDIQRGQLEIKPEALSFFSKNYDVLKKAVFLEWSRFLEKINTLPRIIEKVESEEVKRRRLAEYEKIFCDQSDCFYCDRRLDDLQTHVDHFIPWSYIFEDEAWNLVLACERCNLRKSDSLAPQNFRNDLIDRNRDYQNEIPELGKSLLRLDAENNWEPVIKHHYNNCKEYGFTVRNLP